MSIRCHIEKKKSWVVHFLKIILPMMFFSFSRDVRDVTYRNRRSNRLNFLKIYCPLTDSKTSQRSTASKSLARTVIKFAFQYLHMTDSRRGSVLGATPDRRLFVYNSGDMVRRRAAEAVLLVAWLSTAVAAPPAVAAFSSPAARSDPRTMCCDPHSTRRK